MIRKLFRKAVLILVCMLLLSGCWSRRELNELMIVLGVGMDWEDGEYVVSFQVVNPSEISALNRSGQRPPATLYQGRGKTPFEAARSVTAEAPRKVYLGHLQIYVIGEKLARRGISKFMDNTLRDNEMRMDFNLVIAKGMKAQDVLKLFTPLERLPTQSMLHSLKTSEKSWAPTVSVNVDDMLNKLSSEGNELAITGIQLLGSQKKARHKENIETFQPASRFRYMGIAVFKKDKLIGWLNEKESKGYTDITDKLDSTSLELPCGEQTYIGIEIISSRSRIEMKIVDGKPEANVSVRTEANVVDRMCKDVDLRDPAVLERLQGEIVKVMKGNAEASVKKAKSLKSDVFGFGSKLGQDYPQYWERVKENWSDEGFPELKVTYHIEAFIRKTGTTGNTTMR